MSHRLNRKATGFSNRRRHLKVAQPQGGVKGGFRTGVSAETMKTTAINTRSIVTAISSSSQRGAWSYQRKPAFYRAPALEQKAVVSKGQNFRDILERELGGMGSVQGAKAAGADAQTTQFLTGFWGVA